MEKEIGIGCDPEFILEHCTGAMVAANEHLAVESAFGCDGCNSVGELRPGHSGDIFEVAAKMRKVFAEAAKEDCLEELKWLAGHFKHGHAIGGHIHIEMREVYGESRRLGRYLDAFLIDGLSDLIDPIEERRRRAATDYGRKASESPSAVELKGDGRFEYRTPGSWLLTPAITIANLAIAKIVTLGFATKSIPNRVPRTTVEEKRRAIDSLWSWVPDLPGDLVRAHNIVGGVIYSDNPFDWNADIKEAWL